MSSLGKCGKCNKTVYLIEGFKVGPPRAEVAFHKGCFKCSNEGCTWQLNLGNYTYYEGKAYCKNHDPMKGFSNKDHAKGTTSTADVQVKTAVTAPKLDVVNEQIRATERSNQQGLDSLHIAPQLSAPKLDVAGSGQVRTKDAGAQTNYGLGAAQLDHALNAPKLDVAGSGQLRTPGGEKSGYGLGAQEVEHARNAPKLDVAGSGQVRGATK
eukprot:TRINITY_DN3166_c0_g1_i1.p1 TRINITY_DN3166_c0_g1~~TRINITY_DN3166_c0_g1_i1.p1  ORF type:complete len:221 (+),score=53.84 TRINITY_DN3166_c0_g1_i1:33-665(+)